VLFTVHIAPVSGSAPTAFVKGICKAAADSPDYRCAASVINGESPTYVGTVAKTDAPKQILELDAGLPGNGVMAIASCSMSDNRRPLTSKEVAACRAGIASIGRAILK
jgi:hypothetical protein